MFHSDHTPGSDAWYDELERWMVSEGKDPSPEAILIECGRLMVECGCFIPADYRFLGGVGHSRLAARKAS